MVLSSGLYGKSEMVILKFDYSDCKFETLYEQKLDSKYFAEGATYARVGSVDLIYQLTYKENQVLVWDLQMLDKAKSKLSEVKSMPQGNSLRQGWGLAYRKPVNSKRLGEIGELYATDGSSNIYVIDPIKWE